MTCKDTELINDALLASIDYKIKLKPMSNENLKTAVHQRLVFCGLEYGGEEVLQAIINHGQGDISKVIKDSVQRFLDSEDKHLTLLNQANYLGYHINAGYTDYTTCFTALANAVEVRKDELDSMKKALITIEKGLSKSGGVVIDLYFLREDNVHVAVVGYAVIW